MYQYKSHKTTIMVTNIFLVKTNVPDKCSDSSNKYKSRTCKMKLKKHDNINNCKKTNLLHKVIQL